VSYNQELVLFFKSNELHLPNISTAKGQALALMSHPSIRGRVHIRRKDAVQFFENIGMSTSDAIQHFNKATGLKRIKMRGVYCLEYPFVCDLVDIEKRKGMTIDGDRNSMINSIKNWWLSKLVNIPNNEWHIGHLDPTIEDSKLAYQPPIQSKYRDRFKWDEYFVKMWPTTKELLPRFNRYYTEAEQREMYDFLKQKFDR
jgi:hypothetical protein